jgi:micrococcal nuclease
MKNLLFILFSSLILSGCSFIDDILTTGENAQSKEEIGSGDRLTVKIINVTDGDTLKAEMENSQTVKIRILSIDTPEKFGDRAKDGPQPFADEASKRAEELLLGKEVVLEVSDNEKPFDRYDRLLANIWLDEDTLYQEVVLKEGLARLAYVFEPDTEYIEDILEPAQENAKKAKLGIWSMNGYVQKNGFSPN